MADAGTCNTKCCGKPSCPREGSKCVCTNCKCAKGECLPKCDKNCCGGSEQCASKCGNANCKCGADCKCEPDQCSAECKKGCCGDDYHFTQMKSALCDYSNAGCDYC